MKATPLAMPAGSFFESFNQVCFDEAVGVHWNFVGEKNSRSA